MNVSFARRAVVVLVALGLVAGCSSSSSSSGSSIASSSATSTVTPADATSALQQTFEDVVRHVSPAVVQITTDKGLGSGEVIDANGDIVTNNHVVEGATRVTVQLADASSHDAKILGTFPPGDLAVVKITDTANLKLTVATFADSSKIQVGQLVLAIGNPLGLRSSVTNGIVSALHRTVSEGNGAALPDTIQTSAAINPGNSGGALVDIQGRVIGIPTLAATDPQLGGGAAPGIGFAIPSNTAKDIAEQIMKHGKVIDSHRAYLGVVLTQIPTGGVGIVQVSPGSPAVNAGIQPGSVLAEIDGQPIASVDQVSVILAEHKPGDTLKLTVLAPDGKKQRLSVTLAEYPSTPPR